MGIFINIGNSRFRQIRNSEYIDKSGLIGVVNQTLFTRQKFTCVTRCRRFGKSMAAEMLAAYYDHSCDSRALFADLQIASNPTFEEHLNKYPVIYIDMTTFVTSFGDDQIIAHIQEELIADLQTRLGLNITNVEVGAVDFLKDMAMLRITYDGKSAQEIDRLLKLKNTQLTEF